MLKVSVERSGPVANRPHTQGEKSVVECGSHHSVLTTLVSIHYGGNSIVISQTIEEWFAEAQSVAQLVAPMAAFLGFVGVGLMYMGSSWPIIGQWKGRP